MFGGLDIKSSADKKDEGMAPVPAKPTSGFSFMTASPASAPEPAPAPVAASGFSFMGGGAPAPAPEKAPVPSAQSGFSFLSTPAAPAPAPEPAAAPSGFGFISSATPGAAPMSEAPAKSTISSSFGFLSESSAGSNDQDAPPPKATIPAAAAPGPVAGAGVKFGGASASTGKKTIKRRTRKVGGGRNEPLPPPVPIAAMPSPSPIPEPELPPPTTVKTEAEEAARRAEEFMATMQQQQPQQSTPGYPTSSLDGSTQQEGKDTMQPPASPPVDAELEQARRAAEEAKARLAKGSTGAPAPAAPKSAFAWFSAGARRWGSNANNNDAASTATGDQPAGGSIGSGSHNNSMHNMSAFEQQTLDMGASALARAVTASAPSTATPTELTKTETPEERLIREQEEIKRGMAERNLAMHQMESQQSTPPPYQVPGYGRSAIPEPPAELLPPPPKTPKEEMEDILTFFAKDVKATMDRVGALRQQRNMLLEERFVALAKERLAVQQIAQTEAQQMAAAEAEDYELADRLQVILDGHEREKAEVTAILENISRALSLLDVQTPNVVGAVTSCFRQVETDLKDFQTRQESVEKEDGTEAQKRFTATSKQLSTEDERLRSELKHIERDEGLASDERSELDAAINENTADMEKERKAAKEKLVFVEGEIEFLRKQLQEKQTEMIRLQNEVSFHEGEIDKVKTKFSRQLIRVEKKEQAVRENRKEWENEKTAYDTLKKAHEAEVAAHSEALLANTEVMEALKKEITLAGTFCDVVSKALVFDDSSRNEATEADGALAELQADVVKCEAAQSEAKQVLKATEAAIAGLKTEVVALKQRIPSLEKEKKEAAARRDFKTAGSASKAIKEATARLAACEQEIKGEAADKRELAETEMERLSKELEEKKAVAHEKEKESGRETMEKLAVKIRGVINTKKNVCGTERGDSVQGMGAHVLKAQIQALVLEGHGYGEKFGGWDDFMKELNDEEPLDAIDHSRKGSSPPLEQAVETPGRPSDSIDRDIVVKGKQLMERMQAAERELEQAVTAEDYEKAAELDEVFKDIQAKLEKLGLTDAETELVISGGNLPHEPQADETGENGGGPSPTVKDKSDGAKLETDEDPSSIEPEKSDEAKVGEKEKQNGTAIDETDPMKEEMNGVVDGEATSGLKEEANDDSGDNEAEKVEFVEPGSESEKPNDPGLGKPSKPTTNGSHVEEESRPSDMDPESEGIVQNGEGNHDSDPSADTVVDGDNDP